MNDDNNRAKLTRKNLKIDTDEAIKNASVEKCPKIDNADTKQSGKVGPNTKLSSELNRLRSEGHALERHGGYVTDEQLYIRAQTGIAPDGSRTRGGYTPTSTAFNSDELLVQADNFLRDNYLDDSIRNAKPGTLRLKVSGDTGTTLGRGYVPVGKRAGLPGPLKKIDDLTNVEAWYVYNPAKNIWQTNTIYPIPSR